MMVRIFLLLAQLLWSTQGLLAANLNEPAVLVQTNQNAECNQCHQMPKKLERCSGCKKVKYCNKVCQKAAWPRHKHICKEGNLWWWTDDDFEDIYLYSKMEKEIMMQVGAENEPAFSPDIAAINKAIGQYIDARENNKKILVIGCGEKHSHRDALILHSDIKES